MTVAHQELTAMAGSFWSAVRPRLGGGREPKRRRTHHRPTPPLKPIGSASSNAPLPITRSKPRTPVPPPRTGRMENSTDRDDEALDSDGPCNVCERQPDGTWMLLPPSDWEPEPRSGVPELLEASKPARGDYAASGRASSPTLAETTDSIEYMDGLRSPSNSMPPSPRQPPLDSSPEYHAGTNYLVDVTAC